MAAVAAPAAPMRTSSPTPPEVISRSPDTQPPITQVEPLGMDAEVEVSSEVVEVDIDIDEPVAMESGAQPVAQQTMPPDELEEVTDEEPLATQPSVRPPAESEEIARAAPEAPLANEIEEPTPSSSRRPIAGEAPEAEAYEEESAPRHTPPPESGKQVAAPSVHPPARKSSVPPPPSLEGHTLIGGWREPGLAQGSPGASPHAPPAGVRVPAPAAVEPPQPAAPVPPQPSGTRLSPDVTRPVLPASAKVATIEGAGPTPKPTTAGELLDLTLAL
jgi:hypothetical protein